MAKILVTGAAGQVGSRLVRQLLARDYDVRAMILPGDPLRFRIAGLDLEVFEGSLMDPDRADQAVDGVDAVINTANFVRRPVEMSESEYFDNNVRGTFHLVRAASRRADRIARLVHISTSSVYPNNSEVRATAYDPVDEQHPQRPQGVYAASKAAGENIVWSLARESGLPATIIRPSGIDSGDSVLRHYTVGRIVGVLKTGQAHPASALYQTDGRELWHDLERAATSLDQPCAICDTNGQPWLYAPVDARDIAHGCVCALESPAAVGEAFNISAPRYPSFTEAAERIAERTGETVLRWEVPARWIYGLDIAKAKSRIGYRPAWGIAEMIESAFAARRGETDIPTH